MSVSNGFVSPVAFSLVTSALLVVACGCSNKVLPPDQVMTAKVESGQIQESTSVSVGQVLTVRLEVPRDAERGSKWQLSQGDEKIVAMTSHRQEPEGIVSAEGGGGAPGWEVFKFRAEKPGTTTLKFLFGRPWEGASLTRRYVLDVDVTR
jgi:predicted secreted protein